MPCELWFYDRGKPAGQQGTVLMLDVRQVFRNLTRKIFDFSPEQLADLTAVVWLYRGQHERFETRVAQHQANAVKAAQACWRNEEVEPACEPLDDYARAWQALRTLMQPFVALLTANLEHAAVLAEYAAVSTDPLASIVSLQHATGGLAAQHAQAAADIAARTAFHRDTLPGFAEEARALSMQLDHATRATLRLLDLAEKELAAKDDAAWPTREIGRARQAVEAARGVAVEHLKWIRHFQRPAAWLIERIPDARHCDVQGLRKVVSHAEIGAADWSLTPSRYVSRYDFKRSKKDGATGKRVYENRGEKLGVARKDLTDKIAAASEAADLDADQQAKLQRLLGKDYEVITADDRLLKIAQDLIEHGAARWESGKALLVCIDKVTCARMLEMVKTLWLAKAAKVRQAADDKQAEIVAAADADERQQLHAKRDRLLTQAQWLDETILALIVSEAQGEVTEFKQWSFDIIAHRALMKQGFETPDGKRVDVETAYKDPKHPFRVAVVGAMWLTGFDVKCLSTLYIDKPMKAHTLVQAIARANWRYPGKDFGLVVDYNGMLAALRAALAPYALVTTPPVRRRSWRRCRRGWQRWTTRLLKSSCSCGCGVSSRTD